MIDKNTDYRDVLAHIKKRTTEVSQEQESERHEFYDKAIRWMVFGIIGVILGTFLLYVLLVGPEALTGRPQ